MLLILAGLFGMATVSDDNFSDGPGRSDYAVLLVVGVVAAGLWLVLKKELVVFTVAGSDVLEYDAYRGPGGEDTVGGFISAYYRLRPELSTIAERRSELP